MWQLSYRESLLPTLQGTLSKMGPNTCLKGVSSGTRKVEETDFAYVVGYVNTVRRMLGDLEESGFFDFLADLPAVAGEMTTWDQSCWWMMAKDADGTERTLAPVLGLLSRLATPKVHDTLLHLKVFLADGDENHCLEHLSRIQQDLEEVQPECIHSSLEQLHDLLAEAQSTVSRLSHPPTKADILGILGRVQGSVQTVLLAAEPLLLLLQDVLEILKDIPAIGPRDLEA